MVSKAHHCAKNLNVSMHIKKDYSSQSSTALNNEFISTINQHSFMANSTGYCG